MAVPHLSHPALALVHLQRSIVGVPREGQPARGLAAEFVSEQGRSCNELDSEVTGTSRVSALGFLAMTTNTAYEIVQRELLRSTNVAILLHLSSLRPLPQIE